MDMQTNERRRSFSDVVKHWWHRVSDNWSGQWELKNLDSGELQAIANDVGSDVSELRTLAGRWPESADLLPRRANALNIDMEALSREQPQLANDLKKHCSLCLAKGRCEHDLASHPDDSAWQRYCPNTMTLLAIKDAQSGAPHGNGAAS
jgi:hypothetical protein